MWTLSSKIKRKLKTPSSTPNSRFKIPYFPKRFRIIKRFTHSNGKQAQSRRTPKRIGPARSHHHRNQARPGSDNNPPSLPILYSFSAGYWFLLCCRFRGSSPLFSKKAINPRTQATVRLVERGEGTPRKMRIQQRLRKSRPLTNSGIWISSNCARKPLFVEFRLLVPKRTCWRGFVKIRTRIQLTFLEVEVWAFTPSKSNFESAWLL